MVADIRDIEPYEIIVLWVALVELNMEPGTSPIFKVGHGGGVEHSGITITL